MNQTTIHLLNPIIRNIKNVMILRLSFFIFFMLCFAADGMAAMTSYHKVRLRSLDKITARTMTFDARVGTTIKFGSIYIKLLSCQKPDLQERNDAAVFLQIWEITADDVSKWIFSGWMFASSPALSAMDHPIYDVWLIDCMNDPEPPTEDPEKPDTPNSAPTINDIITKTTAPENTPATDPVLTAPSE